MVAARGWGDDQFGCLVALWNQESGWNVYAYNPSAAPTASRRRCPAARWHRPAPTGRRNPATQISWGLGYITGRYGTPCGAWDTSVAGLVLIGTD